MREEEERRRGLRALPGVDRLLREAAIAELGERFPRALVVDAARAALDEAREAILAGGTAPGLAELAATVHAKLERLQRPNLVQVINATGVIIHTNLGRAPLSQEALDAIAATAAGYSNLESDLESGERGSRHALVSDLLARVTGAEDAIAVNNNAAAVLLALTALAQGGEVVVSRGQAVEIGGGFRIPDVLRQSGARLVEVGTTNRTYTSDFEAAIGPDTALLLRVHSSNFRVVGFVHQVEIGELADLGKRRGVPVLDDIGSGALLDTAAYGLGHEPMPQESVSAGASLVCFSGDKLLGGPQAGLIVGKREYVEKLRRHPLARAVRIDKLSLAALEATLRHYLKGEATLKVPVWQMIAAQAEDLRGRVEAWREEVTRWGVRAEVREVKATVGGGSLPGETLPSWALGVPEQGVGGRHLSAAGLAAALRAADQPVVGRVEHDCLLLDARTVLPNQDANLIGSLRAALFP